MISTDKLTADESSFVDVRGYIFHLFFLTDAFFLIPFFYASIFIFKKCVFTFTSSSSSSFFILYS